MMLLILLSLRMTGAATPEKAFRLQVNFSSREHDGTEKGEVHNGDFQTLEECTAAATRNAKNIEQKAAKAKEKLKVLSAKCIEKATGKATLVGLSPIPIPETGFQMQYRYELVQGNTKSQGAEPATGEIYPSLETCRAASAAVYKKLNQSLPKTGERLTELSISCRDIKSGESHSVEIN